MRYGTYGMVPVPVVIEAVVLLVCDGLSKQSPQSEKKNQNLKDT